MRIYLCGAGRGLKAPAEMLNSFEVAADPKGAGREPPDNSLFDAGPTQDPEVVGVLYVLAHKIVVSWCYVSCYPVSQPRSHTLEASKVGAGRSLVSLFFLEKKTL